jgi:hypothetical protein
MDTLVLVTHALASYKGHYGLFGLFWTLEDEIAG